MDKVSYVHTPLSYHLAYETIPERLELQATLHGNKDVYIFLDPDGTRRSITAKELHLKSLQSARALVRLGINKGDIVALCLPNDYDGLLWLFSIIYAGGIVMNVISAKEDGSDLKGALSRAGVRALIINPGESNVIFKASMNFIDEFDERGNAKSSAVQTLKYLISVKDVDGEKLLTTEKLVRKKHELATDLPRIDPSDISHIFLSSGSTGEPKFIPVSHFTTLITSQHVKAIMKYDPGDIIYTESKFAWVGGFPYQLLEDALTVVTKTIAIPSIEEHLRFTLNVIVNEKCKVASLFPATILGLTNLLDECHEQPLLKSVSTGGLPVTSVCYSGISKLATVISNIYGSTEAGGITAMHVTQMKDNLDYNTGLPFPGVEVKVVDSDGFVIKRGERGAIYVRSPTLFSGYYVNEEKTKEVLSVDRWFNTDDTGYIDEAGNLFVVGRQSDIILQGGKNIVASEVEGFIRLHPGVADVVVVPVPDKVYFQLACACIIPKPGTKLTADDIQEFYKAKYLASATEAFSGFAPRMILIFDEYPRLYTDKPDKQKLIKEAIRLKKVS